jgi:hypothetical protein
MFTWAHIDKDGDLVIDWEEVRMNSNMFDRGHRNHDAEMGKLLSIIQRMCFERGFEEGVKANGLRQLLYETGGNG